MGKEASSRNREDDREEVRRRDVADLLDQLAEGKAEAFDGLFELLYEELRELAHRRREAWRGDYTLN
ncbi:MAG: ECF-type sigma factor, partial [Rhodothermales bacterium]|nr:ECF-type sigma factor [Rhodothermales bacterium]